jgi:hypothetical protein
LLITLFDMTLSAFRVGHALGGAQISVLDLGARPADTAPRYAALEGLRLNVTGVDGDKSARLPFLQQFDEQTTAKFICCYLGTGGFRTLNVCKQASTSTLFEVNAALCRNFDGFGEAVEVLRREPVETVTLDALFKGDDFDLIKSDLQGADLEVLSFGQSTLSKATALLIECEFVEQFSGAPLFWSVASEVRRWGFEFHSIIDVGIRPRVGFDPAWSSKKRGYKQWLWGNALFIRETACWHDLSKSKLIKFASIMDCVFDCYDVAYAALVKCDEANSSNYAFEYARRLKLQNGSNLQES